MGVRIFVIGLIAGVGFHISCMQLEYIEEPIEEIIEQEESCSSSLEQSSSSPEIVRLQIGRYELEYKGISYYEAILLCNKMSIEEDLDTLYSYDAPVFIDDSLFWLPNLNVLEDRSGYRLPTKEEWVLAKENREIEKRYENVGEWLYGEVNSEYSIFELAPQFVKTVGLYRWREGYPVYGMRVVRVE